MDRLLPHLHHGVLLGVGAAFKFYSGTDEKRAPQWMRKAHLEFIFRILQDPKKQLKRCWGIISTLPRMLREEKQENSTPFNSPSLRRGGRRPG